MGRALDAAPRAMQTGGGEEQAPGKELGFRRVPYGQGTGVNNNGNCDAGMKWTAAGPIPESGLANPHQARGG